MDARDRRRQANRLLWIAAQHWIDNGYVDASAYKVAGGCEDDIDSCQCRGCKDARGIIEEFEKLTQRAFEKGTR